MCREFQANVDHPICDELDLGSSIARHCGGLIEAALPACALIWCPAFGDAASRRVNELGR